MKESRSLSKLIQDAKQPETYLTDNELVKLLKSGRKKRLSHQRSYHPQRMKGMLKFLNLIVMISKLSSIITLVVIFNSSPIEAYSEETPDSNYLPQKAGIETSGVSIPENEAINTDVLPRGKIEDMKSVTRQENNIDKPIENPTDTVPNHSVENPMGIVPFIELDSTCLSRLGFKFQDGHLYHYYDRNNIQVRTSFLDIKDVRRKPKVGEKYESQLSISNNETNTNQQFPPLLGFAYPPNRVYHAFSTKNYMGLEGEDKYLAHSYKFSVLIRFHDSRLPDWLDSTLFWFYPTEDFFSALPDSIGNPMKKEYNFHSQPMEPIDFILKDKEAEIGTKVTPKIKEPIPCKFFPSFCEGFAGLDNLNVYPNPASQEVNIEVIISQRKTIQYRLLDISGRVVNNELATKTYSEANQYTERLDLSRLIPGLYILVLIDEEGTRMTKRIVKQ